MPRVTAVPSRSILTRVAVAGELVFKTEIFLSKKSVDQTGGKTHFFFTLDFDRQKILELAGGRLVVQT